MSRALPNILVTGTPGTGKSATAALLLERAPAMTHVEVGALVREKQLHEGWDEELECHILDEDAVRLGVEPRAGAGAAWRRLVLQQGGGWYCRAGAGSLCDMCL